MRTNGAVIPIFFGCAIVVLCLTPGLLARLMNTILNLMNAILNLRDNMPGDLSWRTGYMTPGLLARLMNAIWNLRMPGDLSWRTGALQFRANPDSIADATMRRFLAVGVGLVGLGLCIALSG